MSVSFSPTQLSPFLGPIKLHVAYPNNGYHPILVWRKWATHVIIKYRPSRDRSCNFAPNAFDWTQVWSRWLSGDNLHDDTVPVFSPTVRINWNCSFPARVAPSVFCRPLKTPTRADIFSWNVDEYVAGRMCYHYKIGDELLVGPVRPQDAILYHKVLVSPFRRLRREIVEDS